MNRVSAHSLYHQQIRDFHQWTTRNAKDGLTGLYENARYVPVSSQREWWTIDRTKNIFRSLGLNIDSQAIHQDYICVLSVLVDITKEGCPAINYMDNIIRESRNDSALPWTERFQPDFWRTHEGNLIFKAFINAQWQYCPVTAAPFTPKGQIMQNRPLDRRQVFPMEKRQLQASGESRATRSRRAKVAYMNVHSELNTGASVGSTVKPYCIVFKTYRSSEAQTFKDEYEVNIAVRNSTHSGNILQFLGSFECSFINTETFYTTMSEYADSGTLWDLFLEGIPPYRAEMPGSYGKAFQGLLTNFRSSTISTMQIVIRAYLKYGSVHQDLKPSNLFMFKSKQNDNKYAYKIKIGDFGSSYAQSTLQGPYGPDRGGSREYSPPELFFNDTVDYKASAADDICAFGCIIVETAVWIALGQDGRQAFRTDRKKETQSLPNHEQLGHSDCFHDGMAALKCVQGIPELIADHCRYSDTITPRMVNLALDHALIGAGKRARAGQLLHHINDILRDIQASPVSPMSTHPISPVSPPQPPTVLPSRPNLRPSAENSRGSQWNASDRQSPVAPVRLLAIPPQQPQPDSSWNHASDYIPIRDVTGPSSPSVMTSSLPYVSIQELEKWVKEKKNKNINDLPGWNAAQSLLAKREIIILIDNSKHMQRHSEEVKNSVAAFSYLFKTLDPNGIDVVMASAPDIKVTKKTSTDIKNFVGTEFAAGKLGDCFIEMALRATLDPIKEIWSHNRRNSTILDTFRSPYASSMKSVSVFVLTNGVWDHGKYETSGASTPIQSLIAVMKEHRIDRTNASIQFVRFGNSEVGIRRLEILDDELLDADGNEFDIVDHKPITASIWEILIGSLQRAND